MSIRLYKYIEFKYALTTVRDKEVKLSEINRTNDPWELSYVDRSHPKLDEAIKTSREILSKQHCILCLSEVWDNPVMWAHYASNHQGICFGFDIEENINNERLAVRITYMDELVKIPMHYPISQEVVDAMNFSKHTNWSYEKEVRLVTTRADEKKGKYFINIDNKLPLREVIIGMNCNVPLKKLLRPLRSFESEIAVFKTHCSKSAYRMDRYQLNEDGIPMSSEQ